MNELDKKLDRIEEICDNMTEITDKMKKISRMTLSEFAKTILEIELTPLEVIWLDELTNQKRASFKIKTCPDCKIDYPATKEFFYQNLGYSSDGLQSKCKKCMKKYQKNYYHKCKEKKNDQITFFIDDMDNMDS